MIITLTPNPALDITYTLTKLEIGEVHRVHEVVEKPGGKGLNVARVLAQLGQQVVTTGLLGGATGERIEELLEQVPAADLITHAWTYTHNETRRSIAIVTGDDATVLNEAGADADWETWVNLHSAVTGRAERGDVVAISGSLPPNSPKEALPALISDLESNGVRVIADTSGVGLLAAADAGATLLKPNHHELREALEIEDIDEAAAKLISRGAKAVVVSAGADGMRLYPGRSSEPVSVKPPMIHGNPTGAGDASVASWCRTLADQVRWEAIMQGDYAAAQEAVIDAVATSAAAVARPVAGEIDYDLYKQLLTELKEQ